MTTALVRASGKSFNAGEPPMIHGMDNAVGIGMSESADDGEPEGASWAITLKNPEQMTLDTLRIEKFEISGMVNGEIAVVLGYGAAGDKWVVPRGRRRDGGTTLPSNSATAGLWRRLS